MSIVGYIRESCNNLETLRKMVGRARRARRKDTPIACQGTSPNCGVRISSERSEHCEAMSLEGCAPALPIQLSARFADAPQIMCMFQMAVDKDAVVGYDFFKSFTVLLNRREMRLSFKPTGK